MAVYQDLGGAAALAVGVVIGVVPLPLAEQVKVDEGAERVDLAAELGVAGCSIAVTGAPRQIRVYDAPSATPRCTSGPAPPE